MKSLSNIPINVNGIQNIPNNKSEIAKLSKNTFVIVLIRRLWINVNITNKFPITASRNIIEYSNIVIHVPESVHIDTCDEFLKVFWTTLFEKLTIFCVVVVVGIRSDNECFEIFICRKLFWRCIHSTAMTIQQIFFLSNFFLFFKSFNAWIPCV